MPLNPAHAVSDLDNDGISDDVDSCPNLQEDNEGALDGCPSNFVPWYDEDYDGIEDHIDLCPSVREKYNKFQDLDGCPDISPDG
ncbi:MAG: thrombospondin type 3 repeat-containing protein, partial [Nitrosarchaeum sp.]|nr:thrombospondin type 3 repeat-containing protein [Nitrosarchaeum sp.]